MANVTLGVSALEDLVQVSEEHRDGFSGEGAF